MSMFLLPPPPPMRGQHVGLYSMGTVASPTAAQLYRDPNIDPIDATCVPTPETVGFTAPEGTYTPMECVYLAPPPPHPSDPPPVVVNPLAPTTASPQAFSNGVKLTVFAFQDKNTPQKPTPASSGSLFSFSPASGSGWLRRPSHSLGPELSKVDSRGSDNSNGTSIYAQSSSAQASTNAVSVPISVPGSSASVDNTNPSASSLGMFLRKKSVSSEWTANVGSLQTAQDSSFEDDYGTPPGSTGLGVSPAANNKNSKRSRPKNSLVKNNSSYLSRTIVREGLTKLLCERPLGELFVITNINRSLQWLDLQDYQSDVHPQRHEALTKILLTRAHPLCHDVNRKTKSLAGFDLVVGFSSGDILWIDLVTGKYNRINKNGEVCKAAVVDIKWLPNSDSRFVAAHANGWVAVYDKDREGGICEVAQSYVESKKDNRVKQGTAPSIEHCHVIKSHTDQSKQNPMALFAVSPKPLTSIAFSPISHRTLAVTGRDGYTRLINLMSEQATDVFPSYFGGVMCCAFSPCGQYLATGGQDDLVSLYRLESTASGQPAQLLARLQGHNSYVSHVAFDSYINDPRSLRLGSVGQDGCLLLWDVDIHTSTVRKGRSRSNSAATPLAPKPDQYGTLVHPFVSRLEPSAQLSQPVVSLPVKPANKECEPLTYLEFLSDRVIAAGKDGRIWTWKRPS